MELNEVLKEFVEIFNKRGIDIGKVEYKETLNEKDQLYQFYKSLFFNNVLTVGGEFFINIQPQSKLSKLQEGWYLVKGPKNDLVPDDKNWNKNWIVFGDRNGDAIFYDQSTTEVNGSINKSIIYKLAGSLNQFFYVLTECMKIEELKYNFETRNEEEEINSDFLGDIEEVLNRNLDAKAVQGFFDFFFS